MISPPNSNISHRNRSLDGRYLYNTTKVQLTVLSATKRAKFHLSDTIISGISSFIYDIYTAADTHCKQCRSWKIVHYQTCDLTYNGARRVEFSLIGGGLDSTYSGVGIGRYLYHINDA